MPYFSFPFLFQHAGLFFPGAEGLLLSFSRPAGPASSARLPFPAAHPGLSTEAVRGFAPSRRSPLCGSGRSPFHVVGTPLSQTTPASTSTPVDVAGGNPPLYLCVP